jgi:LPXTG-site transpeptidase (sortase) family protein
MSNGALEPPGDFYTWGWWSGGAVPGAAIGSAVITGHNVNGLSVPMTNLDKTKIGALVTVTTPNGKIRYRVTLVRIIRKTTLPSLAGNVFSQDVPGRLVLVTCDTWNGWEHLTNAVVIAVPVHARFG